MGRHPVQFPEPLVGVLALGLGIGIGVWVFLCHRRGWITLRVLGTFQRASWPVWFWFCVAVYACVALVLVVLGVEIALGL